jgi:predicted transcriptional regulator of viral defense system
LKDGYQPFVDRKKMTRLGEAVARELRRKKLPLVEDADLWDILCGIYKERSVAYLRGDAPSASTLDRLKSVLRSERIIARDYDYARVWRVLEVPDIEADEVVCLLDKGTCVSHLSAMQTFHLTDRRPQTLFITVATNELWREIVQQHDYHSAATPPAHRRHHPDVVRSRNLEILQTKAFPKTTQIKSSFLRVTEIGETFLSMLEHPERCGGMSHVLDVFSSHAETYLDQIVKAVDQAGAKLTKVRAGYIITERLGLVQSTAESWVRFAQRGGSQRLDPKAPYKPLFSERWMISLNV